MSTPQKINWTCPKHPDRLAMLDVCCGCAEEQYGPLLEGCEVEVINHDEEVSS